MIKNCILRRGIYSEMVSNFDKFNLKYKDTINVPSKNDSKLNINVVYT